MKVFPIPPAGFASNTFAVSADGENCILIDCAQPRVLSECKRLGLTVCAAFLTHGHFDHVGGCGELFKNGVKIFCGEDEKDYIFSDDNKEIFGGVPIPEFEIYKTLKDGEEISVCGVDLKVIKTAGHTVGGVSYAVGGYLFTGDTLFYRGVGRCDLPGGDETELARSVKKLYSLEKNYVVCCGHGENTGLEEERKFNPYIRG